MYTCTLLDPLEHNKERNKFINMIHKGHPHHIIFKVTSTDPNQSNCQPIGQFAPQVKPNWPPGIKGSNQHLKTLVTQVIH